MVNSPHLIHWRRPQSPKMEERTEAKAFFLELWKNKKLKSINKFPGIELIYIYYIHIYICIHIYMAMDQYLLIPFLGGWTSINPSYFDVNYRGTIGFDTLPYVGTQVSQVSPGVPGFFVQGLQAFTHRWSPPSTKPWISAVWLPWP
jgi:hypothetical protein